ncbi:MAG: DUF3090 family protein [Acidimicrobiales bacterium]|nr:DUF3090 family protein [Acidimicrobiales bacterium]
MTSFELSDPDVFTTGTVGPPGQRVFLLQVRADDLVVTVRCEKQQVAALADYFDGLLDDLDPTPYAVQSRDLELVEPIEPLWTVGPIGVAYDEPDDRIIVVLEELIDPDELADGDVEPESLVDGGSVKVRLNRAQVMGFVRHSRALVSAGRPPCRFCGLPVDSSGHPCPRMN